MGYSPRHPMLLTGRLTCSVHLVTLHVSTRANLVAPAKLVNARVKYCSNVDLCYTKLVQSKRSVRADAKFASLVLCYPEFAVSDAVLYLPPAVGRGFHLGGQFAAVCDQGRAG